MKKIKLLLLKHLVIIRIAIVPVMGIVALFTPKEDLLCHFSFWACVALSIVYFCLEFLQHKQNSLSPLDRVKKYLLDADGWKFTNNNIKHYKQFPEFTIIEDGPYELHNCNVPEWARGEIGYDHVTGHNDLMVRICYHQSRLGDINLIMFDNGKKTIVAPIKIPIGKGCFYYYMKDSLEYFYQQHISRIHGACSKNLPFSNKRGKFDIPVFKNENELNEFKKYIGIDLFDSFKEIPESDKDKQNELFYDLLDKYEEFRRQSL